MFLGWDSIQIFCCISLLEALNIFDFSRFEAVLFYENFVYRKV